MKIKKIKNVVEIDQELSLINCIILLHLIAEYQQLCKKGPGYAPDIFPDVFEDINECKQFPDICENGYCINMDGSFRCDCDQGFVLDSTGHTCIGEKN